MEDRRIRKSKKALKEALNRLVENKPLKDITITELCTEADINRMTFYKNYGTIQELVKEIYYDYFEEMSQTIFPDGNRDAYKGEVSIEAIEFFKNNYQRMALLTNNYNDKMFLGMMLEHYLEKNGIDETNPYSRYAYIYNTIGSFTLLTVWLSEGCPISEAELAQCIQALNRGNNELS